MTTWRALLALMRDADEKTCLTMLKKEKRLPHALRIHSRLNYVRAHRERAELRKKLA